MNTLQKIIVCSLLLFAGLLPLQGGAQTQTQVQVQTTTPAVLDFANREIVTLRAKLQDLTPVLRVKSIEERLRRLSDDDLLKPVVRTAVNLGSNKGILFTIADKSIFVLTESDLDPDDHLTLEQLAQRVDKKLTLAFEAVRDQKIGSVILAGVIRAAVASILAMILLLVIHKMNRHFRKFLQVRVAKIDQTSNLKLGQYSLNILLRLNQIVLIALWLIIADLWFTTVLQGFPLTRPIADKLTLFFLDLLLSLGLSFLSSLPGILTVTVILLLTKGLHQIIKSVFDNVAEGKTTLPGLHQDTLPATRRIVAVIVWAFGIAIAYPFIPLANSEAFKGLSVMFGFMLTLGSAGIVTQLMSGLILVYSRSLRTGDFVSVGEVTGVVKEMSVLSAKIINMRNEEITLPDALLVSSPIKNYTSMSREKGTLISTQVTIGYDTPWRQVHAMLIAAANKTDGVLKSPEPFVVQKALSDFYVEYELFAHVNRPLERILILSDLHSHIQDEFNTHGVQIMSPHFVMQPRQNVVVPEEKWFEAPAKK